MRLSVEHIDDVIFISVIKYVYEDLQLKLVLCR